MNSFARMLILVLVLAFAITAFAQQPAPSATPNDNQEIAEIHKVLDNMTVAWNQGDLEKYMQGYWNSPDVEFFGGARATKGWKETLDRYTKGYKSAGREMGKLDFPETNVQLLCPDAALVTGRFHLKMSDGKEPHGLYTLLMKKFPDGWRIVHDHSSGE